jgi:hypothetical protein
MDFNKLRIVNLVIINEKVVLSTSFIKPEENTALLNISIDFFKNKWLNKKLLIVGDNYTIETDIIDIQFTISFLGTKYLHFLTELSEIGDIKVNDLIMIID